MITAEEFDKKHNACPVCGSKSYFITYVGIIQLPGEDYYDDANEFRCEDCGTKGMAYELMEIK